MPPTGQMADEEQRAAETASRGAALVPAGVDLAGLRAGVLALLRGLCRRNRIDVSLADDLCNETFCVFLERVRHEPLREPDKVAAFLAQTARNLYIAEARKFSRRGTSTGADELIASHADPSLDAVERLRQMGLVAVVRRVLEQMRVPRDREILTRYYLKDEDKSVICKDLGLSDEHFNRVIDRARDRFRALLGPGYTSQTLFSFVFL